MPTNEAQARQAVVDFYQKTLGQLPDDWYWSSTFPNGHDIADEGSSYGLDGTTWKFTVTFWLRGDIVDTSEEPEHDYPFFDRVVSVWERIGWHKTTDETDTNGTRYVNGRTDTGLETSLQISKIGGIGSMTQIHYPRTGSGADRPDNTFPRLITRNGPAPWTPPSTN